MPCVYAMCNLYKSSDQESIHPVLSDDKAVAYFKVHGEKWVGSNLFKSYKLVTVDVADVNLEQEPANLMLFVEHYDEEQVKTMLSNGQEMSTYIILVVSKIDDDCFRDFEFFKTPSHSRDETIQKHLNVMQTRNYVQTPWIRVLDITRSLFVYNNCPSWVYDKELNGVPFTCKDTLQ